MKVRRGHFRGIFRVRGTHFGEKYNHIYNSYIYIHIYEILKSKENNFKIILCILIYFYKKMTAIGIESYCGIYK